MNFKCVCIIGHRKYKAGELYLVKLKENTRLKYAVEYNDPVFSINRRMYFDEAVFNKYFQELSNYRNKLIDKILE